MKTRQTVAALIAGALFGLGLAVSGMTNANVVQGFLDVTGQWDATLMFVLGGAVGTTLILFALILKQPKPALDITFHVPTNTKIDTRLLVGAAVFGIGWGLAGYCPGPAIATLGTLARESLWFVPAMAAGMWVANRMRA